MNWCELGKSGVSYAISLVKLCKHGMIWGALGVNWERINDIVV